ncbi:MAG: hypothetical protein KC776_13985 [Myxococcales bacterium]|nr:hypothetical protein [Myxococcales bacterium]MCB9575948.1 hypothetical protein [Polyangiaceae bacterium]
MKLLAPAIVFLAFGAFVLAVPSSVDGRAPLAVLFAALVVVPLAAFGAAHASGADLRDVPIRSLVPWSSLFAALVLLCGTIGLIFTRGEPWWAPLAMGAAVALLTFVMSASLWLFPLRPIFALRRALADPERAALAAEELARSFEAESIPARGIGLRRAAGRALAAVGVLADAQHWSRAARVLDVVPLQQLKGVRRAALSASRATVSLYLHDKNRAWAALKDAFAYAKDPNLIRTLSITDALVTAVDGHCEEALTRLDAIGRPQTPRVQRAYLIARAHALAGVGKLDDARACLEELSKHSPQGLERAASLDGPASKLAEELRSGARASPPSNALPQGLAPDQQKQPD